MKFYRRKIDLYGRHQWPSGPGWKYLCSTNASRTCKEAVATYCQKFGREPGTVRAWFAK